MTTKRYGMAVKINDEHIEFYKQNHQNVWPEILEELKKIKISNYSIFLKNNYLFGYFEYNGQNFQKDMQEMEKIPIVNKWEKLMINCFEPFPDNKNNNSWVLMDEIFYME